MHGIADTISGRLVLVTPSSGTGEWHGLLRRGVGVRLEGPLSVRDFMITVLGMAEDYATNSVPGLFLNGAPVDDWRAETVRGGDEVGMSGTMPGLCGIALRRSSPISSFRPDLVSRHGADEQGGAGVARVKMFNFVARDCFLPVLQHGVIVSARAVLEYLDDQGMDLGGYSGQWNGSALGSGEIRGVLAAVDGDMELVLAGGQG